MNPGYSSGMVEPSKTQLVHPVPAGEVRRPGASRDLHRPQVVDQRQGVRHQLAGVQRLLASQSWLDASVQQVLWKL